MADLNKGLYDYSVVCRHCDVEVLEPLPCEVTGSLPSWLRGCVLYNGPGLTKYGDTEYRHAFDASAVMQRFAIEDGKVSYTRRFVRSKTYEQNSAAGSITKPEFGTPAPSSKGMFGRFLDAMDPEKMFSDNSLINISNIGDSYYALCETPFMQQINPDTLETIERVNLNKRFGLMTQSAHPILGSDGYYTVGQGVGVTGPKYSILRFPTDGNLKQGKVVTSVSSRWRLSPAYMHSFALTENYCVLVEQPLAVSMTELISDIANNAPFIEGLKWHNEAVLIHVLDRKTWKEVKTRYVCEPFFFMHVTNAYEDGDHLVLDMPVYKDASMLHNMFIEKLRGERGVNTVEFTTAFRSELQRYVVPVNAKGKESEALVSLEGTKATAEWSGQEIKLTSEKLCDLPFENPCINPTKAWTKHRYVWGMGPHVDGSDRGYVVKLDVQTGTTTEYSKEHVYTAAPEFVPRPDAVNEDDGVLVLQCLDSCDSSIAYLLVLDAADLTEMCRASVSTPSAVPMPLHGIYVPAK